MIACDTCMEWYHGECVAVEELVILFIIAFTIITTYIDQLLIEYLLDARSLVFWQ
jgi:hypothetical protein